MHSHAQFEPLLEADEDYSFDEENEMDVVVDGVAAALADGEEPVEELEPIAVSDKKPNLHETMAEFVGFLREKDESADNELKPRISRQRIYFSIFLGAVITTITAPSVMCKILFGLLQEDYAGFEHEAERKLELYSEAGDRANKMLTVFNHTLGQLSHQFYKIMDPLLDRFFGVAGPRINCAESWLINNSSYHEDLYYWPDALPRVLDCEDGYDGVWSDSDNAYKRLFCDVISNQTCAAIQGNALLFNRLDQQALIVRDVQSDIYALDRRIYTIRREMSTRFFLRFANGWHAYAFIGTLLAAGLGIGLAMKFYHHSYRNYRNELSQAHAVDNQVTDPDTAIRLINTLARLNIQYDPNMSAKQLVQILKQKQDEMELRWKCRTAFLGGVLEKNKDTSIHSFFNNGANKDVKKIILDYADLGPGSTYVPGV